jgi:hypothetical protein
MQLKRRLAELLHTREILAYCQGPNCVQSDEAVSVLRRQASTYRD